MSLPEWYVQQLVSTLLHTPRSLEQAITSEFHCDIMLKHEVLNALYILVVLISTPAWVQATLGDAARAGASGTSRGLATALCNLQQLVEKPVSFSGSDVNHSVFCGLFDTVQGSQSQQPRVATCEKRDVPQLLAAARPTAQWALARKLDRALLNLEPNGGFTADVAPVFGVLSMTETPEEPAAPAKAAATNSIWDSTKDQLGLSAALTLADGKVQTLLSCIRSIENPLGGFASHNKAAGWSVQRVQRGEAESSSASPGAGTRQLTEEQQSIVSTNVSRGQILRIMAFAGSGKTTTLVEYARARPHIRMLYLVFNVSIREAAEGLFPPNVHVMSVHKMAYAAVGRRYPRIVSDISFSVAREALGLPGNAFEVATWVKDTITTFCQSADRALDLKHLPSAAAARLPEGFDTRAALECTPEHTVDPKTQKPRLKFDEKHVLGLAQRLWDAMVSHADRAVPMTHEGYLKLYQMSRPNLGKDYGIILLDEAQDCAPVVAATVLSQSSGIVLVGDPHQSVYSFAGAVDTLSTSFSRNQGHLGAPKRDMLVRRLTRSFRFGPEIARVAGTILRTRKAESEQLIGLPRRSRDDRVRWENPAPVLFNTSTQQCSLPSAVECESLVPITALDSPLQPDVLLARRRGTFRRLINECDFQAIDIGDATRPLVVLDYESQERINVSWSVAILARLNVTLLRLAFELSNLTIDATAESMPGYHAHSLEALYLQAARSRATSVEVPLRKRTGSVIRIAVIGASERNPKETAFNMGVLEDICCLSLGALGLIRDNLIKCFKSMQALESFADRTNRSDLSSQIKFIYNSGPGAVLQMIWRVRCCLVADAATADVVMGTVHKSKGLEFDEVILADDFISADARPFAAADNRAQLHAGTLPLGQFQEEQNLLYVATTRAKWQLWANAGLCGLMQGAASASSVCLFPVQADSCLVPSHATSNALLAVSNSRDHPVWTAAGGRTSLQGASVPLLAKAGDKMGPNGLENGQSCCFSVIPIVSPLSVVCRAPVLRQGTCAAGFVLQRLLAEQGQTLSAKPEPVMPRVWGHTDADLVDEDQGPRGLGLPRRDLDAPPRQLVRRARPQAEQPAAGAAVQGGNVAQACAGVPPSLVRPRSVYRRRRAAAADVAAAQPAPAAPPPMRPQRQPNDNADLLEEDSDDVIVIDSD